MWINQNSMLLNYSKAGSWHATTEKNSPSNVTTIPEQIWYVYSKLKCEFNKFPPTQVALKYKDFKSHYVNLVLGRANLAITNHPLPLGHSWEVKNNVYVPIMTDTAQKMKFSIKDFFSKFDQIRRKLRIWSHLLNKSWMENFIFCAVRWIASLFRINGVESVRL